MKKTIAPASTLDAGAFYMQTGTLSLSKKKTDNMSYRTYFNTITLSDVKPTQLATVRVCRAQERNENPPD